MTPEKFDEKYGVTLTIFGVAVIVLGLAILIVNVLATGAPFR
jgi:Na+-transporting methylmalonyl-CoA/oxaloacetate decarboxylase gamma subunit